MRRVVAVGVLMLAFTAVVMSPASAQVQRDERYLAPATSTGTGQVGAVLGAGGERETTPSSQAVPVQVLASQAAQVAGTAGATTQAPVRSLALTGADILTLVTLGVSLTLGGVVLARRARPRSAPEA